jgi:hypothetical protein
LFNLGQLNRYMLWHPGCRTRAGDHAGRVNVMTTKRCTRCILPATGANIDFDRQGRCNFCRTYDKYGAVLRDYDRLHPLLMQRIERIRGRQRYDCMIGLSGGKDSSYVAYRLCKEYGLNALLVTFDNGFLTDYARRNIALIAERLGADHLFLQPPDPVFHQKIYRSCMKWIGVPCPGCTFPGMLMCIKLAIDLEIPLLVHGRSRPQMFKELTEGTNDPFLKVIYGNFRPYDAARNKRLVRDVVRRMQRLLRLFVPDRKLRPALRQTFYPDLERLTRSEHAPEFIGLFLYEHYDELRMMKVLEQELGWHPPDEPEILTHQDCRIHDAAAYFYTQVCNQPMIVQELSTMIREGEISRVQALERLDQEQTIVSYNRPAALALAEMAGMTEEKLLRSVRRGRRTMDLFKLLLKLRNAVIPRSRLPIPLTLQPQRRALPSPSPVHRERAARNATG